MLEIGTHVIDIQISKNTTIIYSMADPGWGIWGKFPPPPPPPPQEIAYKIEIL